MDLLQNKMPLPATSKLNDLKSMHYAQSIVSFEEVIYTNLPHNFYFI